MHFSNHSGRSRKLLSEIVIPLFIFCSGFLRVIRTTFVGRVRHLALELDLLKKSCGVDVAEELLPELVDNLGTTRGTELSVLHIIVFPSLVNRGFWPLTHTKEYPRSSQSFPRDRTAGVSSSNCTSTNRFISWTYTCASTFVCTSPLAVSTTVGFSGPFHCVHLSRGLIPFCSSCESMLLNRLRILALLVFSKLVPASFFH